MAPTPPRLAPYDPALDITPRTLWRAPSVGTRLTAVLGDVEIDGEITALPVDDQDEPRLGLSAHGPADGSALHVWLDTGAEQPRQVPTSALRPTWWIHPE
ncbi:hypothetical protein BBK14_33345 [Parafrankia soli]|uniref:Uncharacterized protein n=1 Tax=Parafrankia soli TaxID=2599596 RepID=A0A1S1QS93_9ACTN|nr:hypothetical protein [Parafrankia soli]OHV36145.1 hypothetical protein BBK14_33345 [Parafrankia soli]